MFRITKLADYGILLMTYLAADRRGGPPRTHTARDLSGATGIPLPTVSKILKALARTSLLVSHRGVGGGFALARDPKTVSVAAIVTALEGPIALTSCLGDEPDTCGIESTCPVRTNWERINGAVRGALEGLSIADMAVPRFAFLSTLGNATPAAPNSTTPAAGPLGAVSR